MSSAVASNAAVQAAGPCTERFSVPMGRYLGYVVIGAAAVLVVFGAISAGSQASGFIGFAIAFALVAWVVLVRPQVSAHVNGLLMRNMLRDTYLPWSAIGNCKVGQTLQVAAEGKVYHGLGISKSARRSARERRGPRRSLLSPGPTGMGPLRYFSSTADSRDPNDSRPRVDSFHQEQTITNPYKYAEERIQTLAATGARTTRDRRPTVAWDVLSVGSLVCAALAIVLGILL